MEGASKSGHLAGQQSAGGVFGKGRFSPRNLKAMREWDKTMTISKQAVAGRIAAYLRHDISLAELVSWADDALMAGDFAEDDAGTIADVVARLGVADVRAFGLAWEDCEQLLRQLGYAARVDIVAA